MKKETEPKLQNTDRDEFKKRRKQLPHRLLPINEILDRNRKGKTREPWLMCSKTDSASTRRRGSLTAALTKDGSCESCDDRFDALYISYFLFKQTSGRVIITN